MQQAEHGKPTASAVGWMCGNVVVDAVSAVAVAVAVQAYGSLSVGTGLLVGVAVGCVVLGLPLVSGLRAAAAAWPSGFVRRLLLNRDGLLLFVSRFDWALFGVAVVLAGALTSAAVLGLNTVLFVLFMDRLTRSPESASQEFHPIRGRDVWLMFAALGGMAMVVCSQQGGWAPTGIAATAVGMVVAAGAAAVSALSAARFPIGYRMCVALRIPAGRHRMRHEVGAMSLTICGGLVIAAANISLARPEISDSGSMPARFSDAGDSLR